MRGVLVLLVLTHLAWANVGRAQTIELMDQEEITKTFQISLAVLIERISDLPPPRYIMHKAELTFALTNGLDGRLEGKVPVGLVTVEFAGEYAEITTTRQTLTFIPNPTIPTNFNDRGVLAFLTVLGEKAREDFEANSSVIVSEYIREEEFVIKLTGEGKLSFLSLAAAGITADTKNSHTIKLYFCLMATDGTCYDG